MLPTITAHASRAPALPVVLLVHGAAPLGPQVLPALGMEPTTPLRVGRMLALNAMFRPKAESEEKPTS